LDKKLFLLDAYALIFRAYYALIKMPRIRQDGFNTSAIFGFVNTLEEVLRKENPTHIAVCFDPSGPTFRNEAYDAYKGERAATPEDIRQSVPIIKEIVRAYNIPVIEVEKYEADDVIGTLAKRAETEGFTTYMMTPDKDFGQLVSEHIIQYKPAYRGQDVELRGVKEVCEKYGINRTEQVIDLLALMGDKIDNIPGCPGVGEKTAAKLITDYDSVENLLEHTDSLKGALKKKVEENAEQIKFSKYLATICTDAPVTEQPDDLIRRPADREKLFAIFREMEFKTMIDRIAKRMDSEEGATAVADTAASESEPTPAVTMQVEVFMVADAAALQTLQNRMEGVKECGLFLYADGDNDMMAEWEGAAIAPDCEHAYYIPCYFTEGRDYLLSLMAREDILKVTGDAKRDFVLAARYRNDDTPAISNFFDTSLAHYVLQPEMRHTLENLASTYLHVELDANPATAKRTTRSLFGDDIDPEALSKWTGKNAAVTLALREPLKKAVAESGMDSLLYEMEFPLVRVLAEMELVGVRIDVKALNDAAKEMSGRIAEIETTVYEMAGEEFNIGSPAKVGEILFDKLQLDPKAKKTKTGQYSTSEEVLDKLLYKHPIVGKILEYRALKKLLSTYLQALPAAINPRTGKVHTNYNQSVTATGRLSSSSPNLQNIPVRDDQGKEIRRAFIADPGSLFLSADYSQIELRLMADFSEDEIMLDAFRSGKDIHAITAAKIFHKDVTEVTADERRRAKTANFGIIYGISAFGLASRLGIPRAEAKEIIDNYFITFPTVRKYISDSVEHAREKGYVETRMGRRRMLPDINSRNAVVRGYAERNAVNAPLQGTAADIIKRAMILIADEMRARHLRSRMIMQVHDELNFNVVEDEVETMRELVSRNMEAAYSGKVPLTASCGVATNWLDAH
jgi:DNA polymerase-1